jgi:uncharacterized protein
MRVVLDSNIYVSALALPGGSADLALTAALDGRYVVLLSEPLLGEVLGVLGRKFDHNKDELARVALFLDDLADRISPKSRVGVLEDEPDNRILELAVDGRADVIVTGDRAMLRLGSFRGIPALSLRQFLTVIKENQAE